MLDKDDNVVEKHQKRKSSKHVIISLEAFLEFSLLNLTKCCSDPMLNKRNSWF